ncbi:MAG TPA: pantoate--beta-alanine ligase [Saprospiraceae bacterium]|nr:pantoate--beta-alanine ligase [Saprospiraceae bacterium]
MIIIRQADLLQKIVLSQKKEQRSVGFVPTMGALHAGHLSLLALCRAQTDLSICSIFINPTQFNETADLDKYPRTPAEDQEALDHGGCDILFMPAEEEVYPQGRDQSPQVDLGGLDQVLEGEFRPGHFAGVVQVVSRLLDITRPDKVFMGQKDYQQFAIIRRMIAEQARSVDLVMGPTVREPDGLAMSSRNLRLSADFRARANLLYASLQEAKNKMGQHTIPEIEASALEQLRAAGFRPEYFSIVHAHTLQKPRPGNTDSPLVACVAAWAGKVRLIDNLLLKA